MFKVDPNKIDYKKLGFFRFKKLGKDYLLTNETGDYVFLTAKDFEQFLQGELKEELPPYKELYQKNFIAGEMNLNQYSLEHAIPAVIFG